MAIRFVSVSFLDPPNARPARPVQLPSNGLRAAPSRPSHRSNLARISCGGCVPKTKTTSPCLPKIDATAFTSSSLSTPCTSLSGLGVPCLPTDATLPPRQPIKVLGTGSTDDATSPASPPGGHALHFPNGAHGPPELVHRLECPG
ncbi:uncharacterized protein VDAG_08891 [Verticillium dahliae VdLs.17]|uniref:Uncharacterized protein n=1 Tax=Verticillium dahliae (strain VdLs.17 / ATCC MYA-4575 / FGSC 10137) TaxID=498257 RepID=G2XGA4_VERDV|nr:uncharacterized protein VDAG_08891 [Verticillium dahliae VdLs.17]EGY18731.1 hypothetical protein VDAG_08891 [Verticillium dahliae VdLs.17]